jgi:ligand-binding sensor domain-containing protein
MARWSSSLFLMSSMLVASCAGASSVPTTDPPPSDSEVSEARGEKVSELAKDIWVVFQAADGDYWFGSNQHGAYRYDGRTLTRFTTKDGLPGEQIRGFQEDEFGNLFVDTTGGVGKCDGRTIATLTPIDSKEWKLEKGDLWFKGDSLENGPYRYDGKTLHALSFPKHPLEEAKHALNPNAVASPYGVYTIYEDRSGSLWFGTADLGACRFDGESLRWLYEDHLTNPPGGGSFGIRSILEDEDSKFWFCNTRFRYAVDPSGRSPQGSEYVAYVAEPGVDGVRTTEGEDRIYYLGIVEASDGALWMATYRDGVWRYDGESMTQFRILDGGKDTAVISIFEDNRGDLWLGTHEAGPYRFDGTAFEKFEP